MEKYRRVSEPPPAKTGGFIRRVRANKAYEVIVYSTCFEGTFIHWGGGRSSPCYEDKSKCPGHRMNWDCKWRGYLDCYNSSLKKREFFEFTDRAARELLMLLGAEGELRGTRMRLSRGNGDKTEMAFELLSRIEHVMPDYKLPKAGTVFPLLEELWGINESKLKLAGTDEVPGLASA